ncbi:beta/gamma crystallin domain-containing protein [Psychromicrobium sp. YIM B11713]|uniref:beta/gamma crystallin domain-containing protein n=1 Tax=Psychromicrobium sp. YIM B11713 TaxID=3145233 RepID=UPI00374F2E68
MKKTMPLAVAGVTAALLVASAVPAYATAEVGLLPCTYDVVGEYLHFSMRNDNGTVRQRCFADSGEININETGVERFSSGNNAGWFIYAPGDGSEYRHDFGKNEAVTQNYGKVYEVHIF